MKENSTFYELKQKTKQKTKKVRDKGKSVIFTVIFSRTIVTLLLALVQVFCLFAMFSLFQNIPLMSYLFSFIGMVTLIYIVNSDENPAFKLAWAIPICAFPVFGIGLYIFISLNTGNRMLQKKLGRRITETEPFLKTSKPVQERLEKDDGEIRSLARYIQTTNHFPIYNCTEVTFFPSGEKKYEDLLLELEKAEKYIFIEYFIINDGQVWQDILDILKRKAEKGVEVRVMYDGLCAMASLPFHYPKYLQSLGIKAKMFAPIRPILSTAQNNRDHRKILVIDGKVAYNGGINLADEYMNLKERFGHWKDTAIKLEGDAVKSFTAMFLQMWNVSETGSEAYTTYLEVDTQNNAKDAAPCEYDIRTDDSIQQNDSMRAGCSIQAGFGKEDGNERKTGYVMPFNDDPTNRMDIAKEVFLDIISRSEKYVHITTPYLIPDNELITALCFAARRGVDVKIITPNIPDKKIILAISRTYYPQLIDAGVQIYEYVPGFIHAKEMISDDKKAVVGTVNLDFRSLYEHFECATYIYRNPVIADIEKDFGETIDKCRKIDMQFCVDLPLWYRTFGQVGRLLGPLV